MIFIAVFLLSLSSLAFEVLLTRVFSISQWNHLSFMVISVALFGFAASGTFLAILDNLKRNWSTRLSATTSLHILILLYSVSAVGSFIIINTIPLDYFRLPLEPIQLFYLFNVYIFLTLPFFFTGLMVSLAFVTLPEKTGYVYFATMAGSACGAFLPLPSLPLLSEGKLIVAFGLIPIILPIYGFAVRIHHWKGLLKTLSMHRIAAGIIGFGISIVLVVLIFAGGGSVLEVKSSAYKALSQLLQYPHTHIIATENSIRGRVDTLKSPYIRFASGLSLKHTKPLPQQDAVFRDGDNQFVLYETGYPTDSSFVKSTLAFAGYKLIENPRRILLIQNGGGLGMLCVIAAGAADITVVEQNPKLARIVRDHYNVPVVNENPRAFLARADSRFDVIQIENWGTSIPGSAALTQDYSFTIEAFGEYLDHLSEQGILIISRKLILPPSDSLRLWATAFESLKASKFENPEKHIALLRSWDTFTLIVSVSPLIETGRLSEYATTQNFDLVYLPSLKSSQVNRYSIFNYPYYFSEISHLAREYAAKNEIGFFQSYLLDVTPQTDNRPFPARFLKWSRLKELYESTGKRIYTLLMSGEMVILAVFVEAFTISLFLLSLPFLTIRKKGNRPSVTEAAYFLSVGAGFMFVELYFIKQYILLFGDPIISFTVVLSGILVFSGLGGFLSQRLSQKDIALTLLGLIVLLVTIFFILQTVTYKLLRFSSLLQYISAFLILLPCGVMIGLPFPLGMRYLVRSPVKRAHAWTANGCTSVLTSIIAAQIALSFGISYIIAGAAAAYFLAMASALYAGPGKN